MSIATQSGHGLIKTLRSVMWSMRRDKRRIPHLVSALLRASRKIPKLKWEKLLKTKQRIAISMLEHIGDIVAIEPVIRFIKRSFPHAEITFVTKESNKELVSSHPDIDTILTVDCLTEWMLIWNAGTFDLVYDLHMNGRMCLKCCIPVDKNGKAKRINPFNYYNYGSLLDVACQSSGIPTISDGPKIFIPQTAVEAVKKLDLNNDYVVIHKNSNEEERDWSDDKWEEVIDYIAKKAQKDVIIISPRPIKIAATTKEISYLKKMTLTEVAQTIKNAKLFIGIDSGPAHMANAVGTKGIMILGGYRAFNRYMPYSGAYSDGTGATLLMSESKAKNVGLQNVIDAIDKALGEQKKYEQEART